PIDCQTMDTSVCTPTPTDPALAACCTLNDIAYNGTPVPLRGKPATTVGLPPDDHAMFPKTPSELRTDLSRVFQNLLKQVTGRTYPIAAGVAASDKSSAAGLGGTSLAGYEFSGGAKVLPTGLWTGILTRQRITCDPTTLNSTVQGVDPTKGDDFIQNINIDPT